MAMAWPSVSPMVISAPRTFWRAACEIGVTSAKEAPRCGGWELKKTFSDNGLLHFCESNDVQVHGCLVGPAIFTLPRHPAPTPIPSGPISRQPRVLT